jgi:primosomal protein N'
MTNEWFSSYNKCIPLFFGVDILITIKHKKQIASSKRTQIMQKLYIFPSIFSLSGYYKQLSEEIRERSLIIYGQSTQVQRAKAYWAIQNNETLTIFTTHSQIFRDRSNLQEIIVIDKDSSFYQTYQEPRYNLSLVIEKMKEIYGIETERKL